MAWRRGGRDYRQEICGELDELVAQVKLESRVEAQPVAIERTRDLTSPTELIEVVIADATVRMPVGADSRTLERLVKGVRAARRSRLGSASPLIGGRSRAG